MKIDDFKTWSPNQGDGPLVIGGPCSAESEEQVLMIAKKLKENGDVHMFRSGVWKPRTRPGSFEGVGVKALPWLARVKSETGLPTCIEVATAQHVELALMFGIDLLWIGARTTVNPFAVQEIADALKGVDVPVLVKNPINADLSLWIGALERINRAGITKLGAVHRGFSTLDNAPFRNAPLWQIPIKLKQKYPDLPIICDPSHIAGKRDLLSGVCQKALDIDFEGLMIESHHTPDEALSDPAQQVTPKNFKIMLDGLKIKSEFKTDDNTFDNEMKELRSTVDRVDQEIIQALKSRMDIVKKIGELKAKNKITALQKSRMKKLLEDRISWAGDLNLESEYIEKLYDVIHAYSVKVQTDISKK